MDLLPAPSVVVHTENDTVKNRREYEVTEIKGQKEGLVQESISGTACKKRPTIDTQQLAAVPDLDSSTPMRKCLKAYKRYHR